MKNIIYAFVLSGLCVAGAEIPQFVLAGEGSVVPGRFSPKPDTALVSFQVARVYDLNFKDHQYTADLILSISSPKTMKYDFEKELQVCDAKKFDLKQISCTYSGNRQITLLSARAIVFTEFCVADFPFDGQHIAIKLYDAAFDANKLVLQMGDRIGSLEKTDNSLEDGWTIHSMHDTAYIMDLTVSNHRKRLFSSVNLCIDMHRDNAFQLFAKAFIGMFVAAMIAFASLYIDIRETEAIVALGVGGILGAIGNKYIIEGLLPQSCQFCLPDWLHTITIVFILAVITTSVISMRLRDGKIRVASSLKKGYAWLDGKLPLIILTAYLWANLACIHWAVMHEANLDAKVR